MQGKMPPAFELLSSKIDGKNAKYLQPSLRYNFKPHTRKYGWGTHGAKAFEQKRLYDIYNLLVTGDKKIGATHESEHPIGFEAINRDNDAKRGKNDMAKRLEMFAPAYQEEYDHHRNHIGTGNSKERDGTGMNSQEYRDSQRALLLANEPGIAIQLNQLGYGHDKTFKLNRHRAQMQSNNSFHGMMANVQDFSIAKSRRKGGKKVVREQEVQFKKGDLKECLGSRAEALVKRHLNQMDLSLLQEVVEGRIDYNSFLACFADKNYAPILKQLGMEDLQEHFQRSYAQNDRDNTDMDVD
jgi:Agrobacterium VirD5 protein